MQDREQWAGRDGLLEGGQKGYEMREECVSDTFCWIDCNLWELRRVLDEDDSACVVARAGAGVLLCPELAVTELHRYGTDTSEIQDRRCQQALPGGIPQALDMFGQQQPAIMAMPAARVEAQQVCV